MSKPQHSMRAQIISRDPNVWQVKCGRHSTFTAPTYEAAEDQWREHVYDLTGEIPKAFGNKDIERWAP